MVTNSVQVRALTRSILLKKKEGKRATRKSCNVFPHSKNKKNNPHNCAEIAGLRFLFGSCAEKRNLPLLSASSVCSASPCAANFHCERAAEIILLVRTHSRPLPRAGAGPTRGQRGRGPLLISSLRLLCSSIQTNSDLLPQSPCKGKKKIKEHTPS